MNIIIIKKNIQMKHFTNKENNEERDNEKNKKKKTGRKRKTHKEE